MTSSNQLFTDAEREAQAVATLLADIRSNPENVNDRVRRAYAHSRILNSALLELDNLARGVKPPTSDLPNEP